MPLFSPSEELPPMGTNPHGSAPVDCDADNLLRADNTFSLPTPPLTQHMRPRALRLPSFYSLGIAYRHPDMTEKGQPRYTSNTSVTSLGGASINARKSPPASVLTPPEEVPPFEWNVLANVPESKPHESLPSAAIPEMSSETTQQGQDASQVEMNEQITSPAMNAQLHSGPGTEDIPADEDDGTSTPRARTIVVEGLEDTLAWLAPAIMAIASCVTSTRGYSGSLKILSHALPVPKSPGHNFWHVISAIRAQCAPGQLQWINLMHAIQGRLNLDDLPSSPPATPGPPIGGEDYFTTKIFSSAVTAVDDNDDLLAPRAASDRLLSAPGSIELTIVERYIPPSAAGEVNNMFSMEHQSVLVDRLVELTPGGGCLCLIYPTKRGGMTFQREYLDPILDPMLRTIMNMHGLSADFGETLSQMTMVSRMLEYNALRARLTQLCETLNRNDAKIKARLHGVRGTFSVVYGEKHEVPVANDVWSNWWVRQEKQRLQNAVLLYFVRGSRLPEDGKYQQGVLIQEILSGLTKNAAVAKQPTEGIEMGVFVIKRE